MSVEEKYEVEVEIQYEFEIYSKTYIRRDLLPRNSSVMILA